MVPKQSKRKQKGASKVKSEERVGASLDDQHQDELEWDGIPSATSIFVNCGGENIYGPTVLGRALKVVKEKEAVKEVTREKRDDAFEQLF